MDLDTSVMHRSYASLTDNLDRMKMSLRCGICCSTLRNPVITSCLHPFCRECFNACLEKMHTVRCPICNQRFKKRGCGPFDDLMLSIKNYLEMATLYTRKNCGSHVPKEVAFFESQVRMTQNVNVPPDRSPLRHTTNLVGSLKPTAHNPKKSKRERSVDGAHVFQRPEKRVRCDPSRVSQPAPRPGSQTPFKSPLPPQYGTSAHPPNGDSAASRSVIISPTITASTPAANQAADKPRGDIDGPGAEAQEATADRCLDEASPNILLVDNTHVSIRMHRHRQNTTKHVGWKKALLSFDSTTAHSVTSNEAEEAVNTIGEAVETTEEAMNATEEGEAFNAVCESPPTASTNNEIVDPDQEMTQPYYEQHQTPTNDATIQSTHLEVAEIGFPQLSLLPISESPISESRIEAKRAAGSDCGVQVALRSESHEAMSQTESVPPPQVDQASSQTIVPQCDDVAIQAVSSTITTDALVQTEMEKFAAVVQEKEVKKMETKVLKDGEVQTAPLPVATGGDVDDLAARFEAMVNARCASHPAESRIQSLLICMPWIPTYLGMHHDTFCARCTGEEEAVATERAELTPQDANADEESGSVVEASEDSAEKVNETVLEDNIDPQYDEENAMETTLREEMTIDISDDTQPEEEESMEFNQTMTISEESSPCQEVRQPVSGTSLAACPSHPTINIAVSNITNKSQVQELHQFMRVFPEAHLTQKITQKCSYLVLYGSEGQLCKARSLKYVFQIANRGFVVTQDWLKDCIKTRRILPIDAYEVQGDMQVSPTSCAPRRARLDEVGLLKGFVFYLPHTFFKYSTTVTRDYMVEIIGMAGGTCVRYPWDLPSDHALILFEPRSDQVDPAMRYERDKHIPVLWANWVLDSICEYKIIDNFEVYRVAAQLDDQLENSY